MGHWVPQRSPKLLRPVGALDSEGRRHSVDQRIKLACNAREIASALRVAGNHYVAAILSNHLAVTLIVPEEKQLIVQDWPTQRAAKLVLLEGPFWSPRQVEIVVRIQNRVTQEFEGVTVELICPRLGNHVDLAARIVTILGVKIVCDDAELIDGVEVGNRRRAMNRRFLDGRAVQTGTRSKPLACR